MSAALEHVRALQASAKKLRKIYSAKGSADAILKFRVQYANDCCFCNPSKGSSLIAQSKWALRWLARYEAAEVSA